MTKEEALDEMGVKNYATRISFLTPTIWYLNVVDENRVRGVVDSSMPLLPLGEMNTQAGGPAWDEEAASVELRYVPDRNLLPQEIEPEFEATKVLRREDIRDHKGGAFTEIGMPHSYMDPDLPIDYKQIGNYKIGSMNHRAWTAQ